MAAPAAPVRDDIVTGVRGVQVHVATIVLANVNCVTSLASGSNYYSQLKTGLCQAIGDKMMHTYFTKLQNRFAETALSAVTGLLIASTTPVAAAPPSTVTFNLLPNPAVVNCLARFPGDSSRPPSASVRVTRGALNDTLTLTLANIKPDLDFDMFTVERSVFLSGGAKDPQFTNFGLGWYQSDVHSDEDGDGTVTIKTILLDQIFGLDQDVLTLNATSKARTHHTFHVGFWFNNPEDAVPCGFDATKPTPFNGEQKAGPLAMMSRPRPNGLGPLCSSPNTSTHPVSCNP